MRPSAGIDEKCATPTVSAKSEFAIGTVSDRGLSGKRDLERHSVIRGLLLRQLDLEIPSVLSPLEFSLVAQQLDITNPRHAVLTTNCKSGDRRLFARPAHNESPLKGGITTRRGRIMSQDPAFELDVH